MVTEGKKEKQSEGEFYRIAILAAYDGTDFVGFQWQNNGRSVQAVLETALASLYGKAIRVYGCSRTDAGVHASGHVSHADVPFLIPQEKIPLALNRFLPPDIVVLSAIYSPDDFHARFDAKGKRYIYRIWNHPVRPVLERHLLAHIPSRLQVGAMSEAAGIFVGEHDFSAFCAAGGKDIPPVRVLDNVCIECENPEIRIIVQGKSFLYNMVRIIAGTLVYVGMGKLDVDSLVSLFHHGDRRLAGKTMPANGLILEKVFYDRINFPLQDLKEEA